MVSLDDSIQEFCDAVGSLAALRDDIEDAADIIVSAFKDGHKLLICGNGGSAADAQHIAAELVGHFQKDDRQPLPALALSTDTSIITSVANDYSFETIFSRQLEAIGTSGDIFLAISTSGNSENVLAAAETAHSKNMKVIGLTGANGGRLGKLCDILIPVPFQRTATVQIVHSAVYHLLVELVEGSF